MLGSVAPHNPVEQPTITGGSTSQAATLQEGREPEVDPAVPSSTVALRRPSLWLWQLDPEMLKEADMLEWLARRMHAGLQLPVEDADTRIRSV